MNPITKKLFVSAGIVLFSCFLYGCGQESQKNENKEITVACYYFPNYHTGEPRNEAAKGVGWSEWELLLLFKK